MGNKVINLNYVWTMRAFHMCIISLNNKITLNMKIRVMTEDQIQEANTNNKNEIIQINKNMVVEGMVLHRIGKKASKISNMEIIKWIRVAIFGICKIIKKIINKILDMVDGNKGIQVRSSSTNRIKAPIKVGAIISNSTSAGSIRAKAQWLTANPRPLILIHTTGQDPCSQMIQNNTRTNKGSRLSAPQERLSGSLVRFEADNRTIMDLMVRHLCGLEGTRINDMIKKKVGTSMTKRKGLRG